MHVGDLDKSVRHLTPPAFARMLVDLVRMRTGTVRVAVLYCDINGPYIGMNDVVCYPMLAQYYSEKYPVIAHPPCEAWGRFRWKARTDFKYLGPMAIDQVHRVGGIVEHPWRTRLFIEHGRPGASVITVDQCKWDHPCRKRTDLYCVWR